MASTKIEESSARSKSAPPSRFAVASTVDLALAYANLGWSVFPCFGIFPPGWGIKDARCACRNNPCRNAGKHPSLKGGFLAATTDLQQIQAWFARRYIDANLAIATGAASNLLVVDVDPRNGGLQTLAKLEREHGQLARSAVVFTGGGGLHVYYRYPKGAAIGSGKGVFGPGVDLKCDGGYVVAPPSLHKSGKTYRWLGGSMPSRLPVAPKWLLKMARSAPRYPGRRPPSDAQSIPTRDHPKGQRIAEMIGARDRGHYWSIDCSAREHETPAGAMYPRRFGKVHFVCFSAPPCSHSEIANAFKEVLASR